MPSIIDKRLAARIEQKQIETLLMVEGIADRADRIVVRAERAAILAITAGDPAAASQAIRGTIAVITADFADQFQRLAQWSYRETTDLMARTIPRRWMRLANPITVFAGEDERDPGSEPFDALQFGTPTEPVANSGQRMTDDEWVAFCRRHIFQPPSRDKVTEIIKTPVAGQSWEDRLGNLSQQFDSFDRLANTLATSYSQGASREDIASQIRPQVRGIASSARRIARTEGLRIATTVQREQYNQLGDMLAGVQIIATLDENTRPAHAARNGTVYWYDRLKRPAIDELPLLPDEPNCRCYDTPVLKEPAEFRNDPTLQADFQTASGRSFLIRMCTPTGSGERIEGGE